uniref:Ribosomal protein S8 n=1 Tax=Pharyngomonas kirbyi TaxID=63601 RepID=A0A1W6R259_9EUKA|nr:ribosomal protein S8 [Pharyngomonas kirbyi]ARO47984.1 ribosomal protein S8 [Pharyngomonas kirbyi]
MNQANKLISNLNMAIKNNRLNCIVSYSNFNLVVCNILLKEGYFYSIGFLKSKNLKMNVKLKYFKNKSVLKYLKQISKSGNKRYWSYRKLKHFCHSKAGVKLIISTNKGILTSEQALNNRLGGEVLFEYN